MFMKKGFVLQMTVILLSFFLFAGLYLAPKNYSVAKIQEQQVTESKNNIREQVGEIKQQLKPEEQAVVNAFEQQYASAGGSAKIVWLDSIITFWDRQMRPAVSAVFADEKADLTGKLDDRMESGNRFLSMAEFLKEEDKAWAYGEARTAFEEILKQQPDNADAKISLGICIVETTPDNPMQGITMIREVVEKDSTNTRAILQLGHFSVFSGQFPNAIKRYEQALRVDPTLIEAYFFIGDTYAKMGDMENAELYLRKYKELQPGEELQDQVEAYIEELKLKSNIKTN